MFRVFEVMDMLYRSVGSIGTVAWSSHSILLTHIEIFWLTKRRLKKEQQQIGTDLVSYVL